MNFWKTPEFKELQEEYYKKLETSGFKDIEYNEKSLKRSSGIIFTASYNNGKDPEGIQLTSEQKEFYYRSAGKFLHEYKFKRKWIKRIWEMHANGISIKHMVKVAKRAGVKRHASWTSIQLIIKNLSNIMLNKYLNKRKKN